MTEINVIVTASDSMLGKSLAKILNVYIYENLDAKKYKFYFLTQRDLDLREYNKVDLFMKQFSDKSDKTIVVNLSENSGGLVENIDNNLEMYITNQEMNHNLLTICYKYNIYRVINILSTCMFGDISLPLKEEYIDEGNPHYSSLGYATALKNAQLLSTLINLDSYYNYVNLIPTNLYGEYDNYNVEGGTVIPSIINKAYKAINNSETSIKLIGDGSSERMFLYVDDFSRIILDFITIFKEKGDYIISGSLKKKLKIIDLSHLIIEKIIENGYVDDLEIVFGEETELNGQLVRTCINDNIEDLYIKYDKEFPIKDRLEKNINKIIVWFWNNNNNYNKK